jgi:hypothetical protein
MMVLMTAEKMGFPKAGNWAETKAAYWVVARAAKKGDQRAASRAVHSALQMADQSVDQSAVPMVGLLVDLWAVPKVARTVVEKVEHWGEKLVVSTVVRMADWTAAVKGKRSVVCLAETKADWMAVWKDVMRAVHWEMTTEVK